MFKTGWQSIDWIDIGFNFYRPSTTSPPVNGSSTVESDYFYYIVVSFIIGYGIRVGDYNY